MAGKVTEITPESLETAIQRFCDQTKGATWQVVEEDGKKQCRVLVNGDPDIFLWLEEGHLRCSDAENFGPNFYQTYLKPDPVESLRKTKPGEHRAMMPTNGQRSGLAPVMSPGPTLTLEKVRDYFCKTATDEECAFALEVCAIRGLNPFKADCYLVKYEGKNPKLEILVSNSFLLKKAMANPDFEYYKAGVTVQKGEEISNVKREYAYPGETLLGGWAEMKRKSISEPFWAEIPLAGNKKDSKWWVATPGHMIRKTASSQVAREAFPEDLAGLYDIDEMGFDPANEVQGA